MGVVYFGTSDFAVPALRVLAPRVQLVVTQPDRPTGRGLKVQASPVKLAAIELGLPVANPEKARSPEFVAELAALQPDVLWVAAYGQILSQKLLDSAKLGGINLHGSVLPKYRGAAPIQRAILDGETVTGVSLMQMDRGMDTGDVIAIETLTIGPDETYGELQDRLAQLAASMTASWIEPILAGQGNREPQDHDRATLAPKIDRSETTLTLHGLAEVEYRKFRAFTPAPGSSIELAAGPLNLRAVLLAEGSGEPGTVLRTKPELEVACAAGSLILVRVQPSGKAAMRGADFANGARLKPGDRLPLRVSEG